MKFFFAKLLRTFILVTGLLAAVSDSAPFYDELITLADSKYGDRAANRVREWRQMMEEAKNQTESAKLLRVNDFFNQNIVFSSDIEIWGESDYWATPLETMAYAQGDCEDFSIAKYISLLKLNIPIEKLRLIYVKAKLDSNRNQAHMILAFYANKNSDPLVLDNLTPIILPASKRVDLTPVYSFNSAGLWVGNDLEPKLKKPETRLSKWREVLIRMRVEGLK